ncbi:MAG: hypothetical protein AUH42_04765 [Gemmatimonadetes bacterium 13_1_40CM_70_11]|nr:MAG: hypothetical protein AUH42_04765 [Gemmatimonadetes bacterium 13_1_40CM_70_11]
MITFMRRYRRSLQVGLLVVIAAFVASLFIFGTSGLTGSGGGDAVATVNGETIPVERYQRRYQEYSQAYAQMLRDRFSTEVLERMGLPQQVIDDLVQETLIVQRARQEGMEVTDEELGAQIRAMPAFHEGGRFTVRRYDDVLKRAGYTKSGFESEMRRRLTRTKVEGAVRGGVKVTDAEVEQAFVQQHEEVRAAWALVEAGPIAASLAVSDAEAGAYLKSHEAEFRQPERRRVQYVAFAAKDFTRPVSGGDVEKYYTEHAKEFESPAQAHGAHILARVPETGGSEGEDKARGKIADAIRRARAGEDFGKLARELSEDTGSAKTGGDLGWVSKGDTVPAFEQALFALKKGEISAEPVRSPFGFHAIKLEDKREGGRKPLKEVAGQIRTRLGSEAADRAAKARADEARAKLAGATDFTAEARSLGLAPVEATIARRVAMPGLAPRDPLEETAFELAQGGVSAPVKTPAGWIVLKQVRALPAAVPALEEIKDKVQAAVKREKAEAVALERARRIVADAREEDLLAAARKAGAATGQTPRFSRAKPAERLPGDALHAALATPAGALTEPVKSQQGYYVLKVLERVPPATAGLPTERDKLAGELLARKQSQVWQSWLASARAGAKIETTTRVPGPRG